MPESLENLEQMAQATESFKILWVDDDEQAIASAKRLARNQPWTIVGAQDAEIARMLITAQLFSVVVADHRLNRYCEGQSGTDLLEYSKEKAPATSRILITGAVGKEVIEDAVNRAHVFRFIAKPWDNEQILVDINKAIEHHQLKIAESNLLKEVSSQNRQLEQLTSGLEQLVTERTLHLEASKNQVETQLSHVRDLVRFIKDLSLLTSVDELMGLIRKELKVFHELRSPVLGYVVAEGRPIVLSFQGKQVIEREARQMWSPRIRMRINAIEDRVYLANEFGRPFVKVLAIPLKRRAVATDVDQESPATLFFEHTLPDEKVEGFITFITERLQPIAIALDRILLEYHLKYTAFQWESTFDGLRDPIAIVDIDYRVVRSNRYFNGETPHRLFESTCHKLFAGIDSVCRGCPVSKALETGLPQKGQIKRDGSVFDVLSYPIRVQGDHASTNVINHYSDVTASRELHSRMVQSEKMAAIGLLAGNIAHELNNPLTGIRSLAQVLLHEIPRETSPQSGATQSTQTGASQSTQSGATASSTLREDIAEVERAAERSQKIIENLLDFSKGDLELKGKEQLISLNEIVNRTLPMLKTAMHEHRSEVVLCDDEGARVRVEPHLMQQVVFNLVNNGCQAMKDAGTLSIETRIESEAGNKKWYDLTVADTGSGIPTEIIESIFEPFFTTKEEGQGTGLGLSMSQSIIQRFGGEIRVQSEVGKGAQFQVRLPVVDAPASDTLEVEKVEG